MRGRGGDWGGGEKQKEVGETEGKGEGQKERGETGGRKEVGWVGRDFGAGEKHKAWGETEGKGRNRRKGERLWGRKEGEERKESAIRVHMRLYLMKSTRSGLDAIGFRLCSFFGLLLTLTTVSHSGMLPSSSVALRLAGRT